VFTASAINREMIFPNSHRFLADDFPLEANVALGAIGDPTSSDWWLKKFPSLAEMASKLQSFLCLQYTTKVGIKRYKKATQNVAHGFKNVFLRHLMKMQLLREERYFIMEERRVWR